MVTGYRIEYSALDPGTHRSPSPQQGPGLTFTARSDVTVAVVVVVVDVEDGARPGVMRTLLC